MSILFLLLLGCILEANADQPIQGTYTQESDSTATQDLSSCKDLVNAVRCRRLKYKIGCEDPKMQRHCARTCRLCHLLNKAPAPPKNIDCKETTYGCCWDGITIQFNDRGEGCPPCEDEREFAALCGLWEQHCHNTSRPVEHQVVREHCHRTCNNCFVLKATEQTKVVKTLPPVLGNFVNSDDSPRRGAIYVWSKFVNPFKFDGFNEK